MPEDDEEAPEGSTEVDGIVFEGDFEDDSVKPSLTSLLEDVGDDVGGDAFKLDSDDSFFSIPDYVPSELPDLAALGSGAFCFFVVVVLWGWEGGGAAGFERCSRADDDVLNTYIRPPPYQTNSTDRPGEQAGADERVRGGGVRPERPEDVQAAGPGRAG